MRPEDQIIERCRWWLVSSPELFPAPLFTDPDTVAGLIANSNIPGLTAEPSSQPGHVPIFLKATNHVCDSDGDNQ